MAFPTTDMPGHRRLHERVSLAINTGSEATDSEIANLRAEISRLHDPAELERLARECLGMVGPGEVAFVMPGRTANPSDC